jgi:hypothetical protein
VDYHSTRTLGCDRIARDRQSIRVWRCHALETRSENFSLCETKRVIAQSQSLAALYGTAKELLPELGISNDSIAYYAALVRILA